MSKNKVEIKQERKFNKKVLEEKKNSISWVSWKVYILFLLLFEIVSLKLVKYLCELNLNQFPQNQSR